MNCSSQHDCNYDSDYADKNGQYANNNGLRSRGLIISAFNPTRWLRFRLFGKFSVTFYDKDNKVLPGFPQTTDYVQLVVLVILMHPYIML